jgi:hypothetical protein
MNESWDFLARPFPSTAPNANNGRMRNVQAKYTDAHKLPILFFLVIFKIIFLF